MYVSLSSSLNLFFLVASNIRRQHQPLSSRISKDYIDTFKTNLYMLAFGQTTRLSSSPTFYSFWGDYIVIILRILPKASYISSLSFRIHFAFAENKAYSKFHVVGFRPLTWYDYVYKEDRMDRDILSLACWVCCVAVISSTFGTSDRSPEQWKGQINEDFADEAEKSKVERCYPNLSIWTRYAFTIDCVTYQKLGGEIHIFRDELIGLSNKDVGSNTLSKTTLNSFSKFQRILNIFWSRARDEVYT